MAIKLLLIASALAALVWLIRAQNNSHRLLITRLAGFLVAGAWIVAVLYPDLLTQIGNAVGVGRGTDLLLYVLVVVFTFTTVGWYQRVRQLDEQVTQLTRSLALVEHQVTVAAVPRPDTASATDHRGAASDKKSGAR